MDLEIQGKVALITGSTQGIGLAIARALLAEGCQVMWNGRDPKKAESLAITGPNQAFFAADVTSPSECRSLVEATVKKFGRIDVLVCNVGSGKSVPPGQEKLEEWKKLIDLNLMSAVNMIDAARPELSKRKGSIVCISSICGLESLGAPIIYSAAKSALNSYVRGMSRPLAREGIRINAVAPGNIFFEGSTWEQKLKTDPTAVATLLEREVALNRFGQPEEIANAVAFLASPRANFICGSIQVVDGGQTRS